MIGPGDSFGPYTILQTVARGGMATLFLAKKTGDHGFERHVAVKVVHEHLSPDPQFRSMILDEARLAARIQHPNVVGVEDLGERNGAPYLVMEYVHGVALSVLLRQLARQRRRMKPALAVHVAIEAAQGLHGAHQTTGADGQLLGVVHRDVSPENILLAYEGHVKLIDFGIAKAKDRATDSTVGGVIKGKYRYMAPEQAAGKAVDRRTDVYALGIVLWECLTMRRYFRGSTVDLLTRVRKPEPVAPSTHAPHLPRELDAAVLRALSPDPARRPPTALAFAEELQDAFPQALRMHATKLSELLRAVFPEELRGSREALPQGVVGEATRALKGSAGKKVLATLTVDNADLSRPSDLEDEGGSSAPDTAAPAPPGFAPAPDAPIEPPPSEIPTLHTAPARPPGFDGDAVVLSLLLLLFLGAATFLVLTYLV